MRALALAAILALGAAGPAAADPANSIRDLWPALTRCWRAPPGTVGSEITVALSLKRNGELLGRPQITYSRLTGDAAAQRAFVASVLAGLAQCTPVAITDGLGGAIAGRRLSVRFRSRPGDMNI